MTSPMPNPLPLNPAKARALLAKANVGTVKLVSRDDAFVVLGEHPKSNWFGKRNVWPLAEIDDPCLTGPEMKARADLIVLAVNALPHLLSVAERETWQPIETAPKDGTDILASNGSAVFGVYWNSDVGGWSDGCTNTYGDLVKREVSHWMPLPAPPTPTDGEGA